MIQRLIDAGRAWLARAFPRMDCSKCGRDGPAYDDGLCAECWWDGEP